MVAPRSVVAGLPAYRPGRSAEQAMAAHGIESAVKLASNELAFGPLPSVAEAIGDATDDIRRYPSHGAPRLRAALAEHLGVAVERVAVGNGSVGLLQQLTLTYVDPGDRVVYGWPSFEAYPVFTALAGGVAVTVPNVDHTLDPVGIAAAIDDRTRLILVANPNNPTSTAFGADGLLRIADATPADAVLVVDEAYREFVTDPDVVDALDLLADRANVAVLRTSSKAHGLAGLRVGHLVGSPAVVDAVDRTLVPFAVNHLAAVAAMASLDAIDDVERRCKETVVERERVAAAVRDLGLTVPHSQANFIWLPLVDESERVGDELERRGVVTRVFADVGIRVTVGTTTENDRFLAALSEVIP